jgi:hypothetical protein
MTREDGDMEDTAEVLPAPGGLMATWQSLTKAISLNALPRCHIGPQASNDEEKEQLEMRSYEDKKEQEMEEGGREETREAQTQQPQERQAMQPLRSLRMTEMWKIDFEMPTKIKLDVGLRITLRNPGREPEQKRVGIITSVFKRNRAEVIFRVKEERPLIHRTIYLSAPLRTTQLAKEEGFLNWMVSKVLYRERSLRPYKEKLVADMRNKHETDTAGADRLLKAAIDKHRRTQKAAAIKSASGKGGKAKMNDVRPVGQRTPKTPTARRIKFEGEGEASTSKLG